jgi:hypothetical protein
MTASSADLRCPLIKKPTPTSTTNQLCQQALQSHAPNAIINQLSQTNQHPSHLKNRQQRNDPSEGKTNCYINPATETQTNNQVTKIATHKPPKYKLTQFQS